jgi:hypothetical protein
MSGQAGLAREPSRKELLQNLVDGGELVCHGVTLSPATDIRSTAGGRPARGPPNLVSKGSEHEQNCQTGKIQGGPVCRLVHPPRSKRSA